MSKLTTKERKSLPASDFAGPGRSYPIPDRSHAANAEARATQMERKGIISSAQANSIKAKAQAVLKRGK